MKKKKKKVEITWWGKVGLVNRENFIINNFGLTHSLIARLPRIRKKDLWRIGHFPKVIPEGYEKTIQKEEPSQLSNKFLALYCKKLWKITRGKLFNWERVKEIFWMNIGKYEHLLEKGLMGEKFYVFLEEINFPKKPGTLWNDVLNFILAENETLAIILNQKIKIEEIEISLDWNDKYEIIFFEEEEIVGRNFIGPAESSPSPEGGLEVYTLKLPSHFTKRGITSIEIIPVEGDRMYSIGHLRITKYKN